MTYRITYRLLPAAREGTHVSYTLTCYLYRIVQMRSWAGGSGFAERYRLTLSGSQLRGPAARRAD